MTGSLGESFRARLAGLDPASGRHVPEVVDLLLREADGAGVSDIHVTPGEEGVELRWRVDGVLHRVGTLPLAIAPNVVARMKVLADLLTYRSDTPQEGRIRGRPGEVEMRVSTFPTLHGEKVVVRLFPSTGSLSRVGDLGLPSEVEATLTALLAETSGAVMFAGPAGSGKTTTLYACLRELASAGDGRRSLASLEDPIEVKLPGVAQSQVNLASGFTLESGLRSLMRQDPEVIAVGEIRDSATAEVAFQASLTGHLVLTTFHAGSASGALGRLADMGIEPYLIRSGIRAVVFQRLVRRLCRCAIEVADVGSARLGLPVSRAFDPLGCEGCHGTGFRGRALLAEMLDPSWPNLGRAVLSKDDVAGLEAAAAADGMVTRWSRAVALVEDGVTTPTEVRRVLGVSPAPSPAR